MRGDPHIDYEVWVSVRCSAGCTDFSSDATSFSCKARQNSNLSSGRAFPPGLSCRKSINHDSGNLAGGGLLAEIATPMSDSGVLCKIQKVMKVHTYSVTAESILSSHLLCIFHLPPTMSPYPAIQTSFAPSPLDIPI